LRARHRQKHETASDLRALALAGDPEALIRALTKLHAFARLPRRWDTEFERHATHPSLARRIQAIRAAAGTPPASLGQAATFAGADGASSVTFHDDRLLWNEGASTSHTLGYGDVTMLRVDARRSGASRLVAADGANRRWEIVLRPSDVARAQATLDIVDTRLAAAAGPPVLSLALSRALAILALIAAFTIGQFPVALLGCIAALLPMPSMTAAAGAASVAAAALVWRDHVGWMKDTQPWIALALMICGLGLIARQHRQPPRESATTSPRLGAGLAASSRHDRRVEGDRPLWNRCRRFALRDARVALGCRAAAGPCRCIGVRSMAVGSICRSAVGDGRLRRHRSWIDDLS
jgi:hypothetical protein